MLVIGQKNKYKNEKQNQHITQKLINWKLEFRNWIFSTNNIFATTWAFFNLAKISKLNTI